MAGPAILEQAGRTIQSPDAWSTAAADRTDTPLVPMPTDASSEDAPEAGAECADSDDADLYSSLDALSQALDEDASSSGPRDSGLRCYSEALEALARTAERAAMTGLVDVCARLGDRITCIRTNGTTDPELRALLSEFPVLIMDYAAAPDDSQARDALSAYLDHPAWQAPLREDEAPLSLLTLDAKAPADSAADDEQAAALQTAEADVETMPARGSAPVVQDVAAEQQDRGLPQRVDSAVLKLLGDEFAIAYKALNEALADVVAGGPDDRGHGLERFADELDSMAAGAAAVGLTALQALLLQLRDRIAYLHGAAEIDTAKQQVLASVPQRVGAYLASPLEREHCTAFGQLVAGRGVGGIVAHRNLRRAGRRVGSG